jgi:hypothetical protein
VRVRVCVHALVCVRACACVWGPCGRRALRAFTQMAHPHWQSCADRSLASVDQLGFSRRSARVSLEWTQSRCRCGRGEPSPGADVADGVVGVEILRLRHVSARAAYPARHGLGCAAASHACMMRLPVCACECVRAMHAAMRARVSVPCVLRARLRVRGAARMRAHGLVCARVAFKGRTYCRVANPRESRSVCTCANALNGPPLALALALALARSLALS